MNYNCLIMRVVWRWSWWQLFFDGTDDKDDDDNDDVQHDVKDDPIVDLRRRLEHNIMSSITGSRHNCEQGQPKPQLGGVHSPPQQRNHRGGGEGHHHRPHPTGGGGGGYHGVGGGGGGGGVWQPCIIYIYIYIYKGVCSCVDKNTCVYCKYTLIPIYMYIFVITYGHRPKT